MNQFGQRTRKYNFMRYSTNTDIIPVDSVSEEFTKEHLRVSKNTTDRELMDWRFITFDRLTQYASWVAQGGGKNIQGGSSTVVKIPKCEFTRLSTTTLATS